MTKEMNIFGMKHTENGDKPGNIGVLPEDGELKSSSPFRLSKEIKEQLVRHKAYYLDSGVIMKGSGGVCAYCGQRYLTGQLYVEDDASAVSTCLECADTETEVDGESFIVRLCVAQ